MKRSIVTIIIAALVAASVVFGANTMPVYANSALRDYSGVDSSGAIMTGEQSPIEVESELLTFDLPCLPSEFFSRDDFENYNAKVTAQYTFYNPSEYTVTAKLLFPFGNLPAYVEGYFEDDGSFVYFDDTQRYAITVNGEETEKTVRHTYSGYYSDFDLERDIKFLSDDFVEDDFFNPDLAVTKYLFKVDDIDTQNYSSPVVALEISIDEPHRFYFPDWVNYRLTDENKIHICQPIRENAGEFGLYVFGTPDFSPQWKIYRDDDMQDGGQIAGEVSLISAETCTLLQFALSDRAVNSPVSDVDWYNALVAELNGGNFNGYPLVDCSDFMRGFENCLLRWYEYQITIAPEERIVNCVTAPIYPAIDTGYNPNKYEYTYLLSPAKTWKSFGSLEIVVNTPYYVLDSSLKGFEKTENGYAVTFSGLPDGELNFTLCQSQTPKIRFTVYHVILIIFIILISLAVLSGIILLIAYFLLKKDKQKSIK